MMPVIIKGTLVRCEPADIENGSFIIPDDVTSIGDLAFWGCTGLTAVTIPHGVTSISDRAFWGCTGLTSITIPDSVTSIGGWAFDGCTSLASITIPRGVTSISIGAFPGCTGLTSVTIPNGVTSIGGWAFEDCTSLTSVTIPHGVTSIGWGAFNGCTKLNHIYIEARDDKEFKRIKALLPPDLQKKATQRPMTTKPDAPNPADTHEPADTHDQAKHRGFSFHLHRVGVVILSALAGIFSLGLLLFRKPKHQNLTGQEIKAEELFNPPEMDKSSMTGLGFFHRLEMEQKLIGHKPNDTELLYAGVPQKNLPTARAYFGRK